MIHAPRPTLYGSRHAASAGHYLAAAAAFSILEAGGNAIDAGCCAGIALGVLHPDEVNVAGVAPIMIRTGAGRIVTIAGLGHWPKSFPADLFMREHDGKMPLGLLRTVVPAAPDAWITALRDFGTMSFGDVAGGGDPFRARGLRGLRIPRRGRSSSTRRITASGRRTPRSSCRTGGRPWSASASSRATSRRRCNTWRTRSASARARGVPPASRRRARRSIAATSPSGSRRSTRRTAGI